MQQDSVLERYRNLHIELAPGRDRLLPVCRNPNSVFCDPDVQILKHDHATSVVRKTIEKDDFVIKQYHLRNPGYALKRSVRRSRARHCWNMATKLLQLGIATAQPIAIVEERFGLLRRRSWLLSEWLDGDICSAYLLRHGLTETTRPVCQALLNLLHQLRQHSIAHGDLKASNILLTPTGPALIDLDGTRMYRPDSPRWRYARQRDLRRFLRNWEQQPELLQFFTQRLIDQEAVPGSLPGARPKTGSS